jgi:hypothetical protein
VDLFPSSGKKYVDGTTQLEPFDRAILYVWVQMTVKNSVKLATGSSLQYTAADA